MIQEFSLAFFWLIFYFKSIEIRTQFSLVETMLDYCKAHHTQRGTHKKFFLGQFFCRYQKGTWFYCLILPCQTSISPCFRKECKKKVLSGKLWRRHLDKKSVYNHDCLMQILFLLKVARQKKLICMYNSQHLILLFLSLCVYFFKNCPSQFLSHWESAELVFCSQELSSQQYKYQNKDLIFSSWQGKFKFCFILRIILSVSSTGPPLRRIVLPDLYFDVNFRWLCHSSLLALLETIHSSSKLNAVIGWYRLCLVYQLLLHTRRLLVSAGCAVLQLLKVVVIQCSPLLGLGLLLLQALKRKCRQHYFTLRFFFKFVSRTNNSNIYHHLSSQEEIKFRRSQTAHLFIRNGVRGPNARLF